MNRSEVRRMVTARVPIAAGQFRLVLYQNGHDSKEHLALVRGDIGGRHGVLVRVHSECFTGDVMGSERCDCGEQLQRAVEMIEGEGCGAILYLRQEGRGIGLLKKLEAYNLQDLGFDTVDANRLLGHEPDERDYSLAAAILKDLEVDSVRLLTNNPAKVEGLRSLGIEIRERLPLHTQAKAENVDYLRTKADRLDHELDELSRGAEPHRDVAGGHGDNGSGRLEGTIGSVWVPDLLAGILRSRRDRPAVTLTYAQSVDGCIAARADEPLILSGPESMAVTHALRGAHDAILVGVGTVLADDPRLTVRLVEAEDPRPVILDTRLRTPPGARLMGSRPWIAAAEDADLERQAALEAAGAEILMLPVTDSGRIDLERLLRELDRRGVGSLMVEGGATVISSFLASRLVDSLVITVAPTVLGGLPAVTRQTDGRSPALPRLRRPRYRQVGEDLLVWGEPEWS